VPAIPKKFVSKEATSEAAILKLSWKQGRVYVTPFRPTRNWREEENLPLTCHLSQGQQNLFSSKRLPTLPSSILSFWSLEHVWLKTIWLKNSYNPEC